MSNTDGDTVQTLMLRQPGVDVQFQRRAGQAALDALIAADPDGSSGALPIPIPMPIPTPIPIPLPIPIPIQGAPRGRERRARRGGARGERVHAVGVDV